MISKKPSHAKCYVRSCPVGFANRPEGVAFFSFPRDERLQRWVEAVKGKGSTWIPPRSASICSLHFTPKDFWKNPGKRKLRLLPGAVPLPAPQFPPSSTIKKILLPNCMTYVYRKKADPENQSTKPQTLVSAEQQQPSSSAHKTPVTSNTGVSLAQQQPPSLADKTPGRSKTGVSLLRKTVRSVPKNLVPHEETCETSAASPHVTASNTIPLPVESPAADRVAVPLALSSNPQTQTSTVIESPPSSSTPTGLLLNAGEYSVPPSSPPPPPSRKRGAVPPDVLRTPPKAVVLSGPSVPVCLDIEEGDSPRKIALKQMLMHYEAELEKYKKESACLKKERDSLKKQCDHLKEKAEAKDIELNAMKEIVRKAESAAWKDGACTYCDGTANLRPTIEACFSIALAQHTSQKHCSSCQEPDASLSLEVKEVEEKEGQDSSLEEDNNNDDDNDDDIEYYPAGSF